jgi:peptidyl-prolyl cis-trans isomerase B (cyclophilin B)
MRILAPIVLLTVPLAVAGCSSSNSSDPAAPSGPAASSAPASSADTAASPSTTAAESLPTSITFTTNRGPITISTNPAAPATVAAQAKLANEGYFDDSPCHRLVTEGIYVLQCGDPTGTGTGGPGYRLPDENLPQSAQNNYPAGTVAMANSGPNTAGSQFFIVYQDSTLPPGYTIWGSVDRGLNKVKRVAASGTKNGSSDGPPKKAVTIESTSTK